MVLLFDDVQENTKIFQENTKILFLHPQSNDIKYITVGLLCLPCKFKQ